MMKEKLQDRELSIMNLFWAVCLKWKLMIVVGFVFALLAGAFSYYKSALIIKAEREAELHPVKLEDLGLEDELTEATEVYLEYLDKYKAQMHYNETSPFMQLDSNGFYKGEVSYSINTHYKIEYPVISERDETPIIAGAYQAILISDDFRMEAAKIMGYDEEKSAYCMDLIDASNRLGSNNSMGKDISKGIYTVSVYADNEERCEKLLGLVVETIEAAKNQIAKDYGAHDMDLIAKNCYYTADPYLLSLQREQLDRLRDYYSRMVEIERQFTDEETQYMEVYKKELNDEIAKEHGRAETGASGDHKGSFGKLPTFSKKLIIVGFIGGVFLIAALYALGYIMSRKVRIEDQPAETFGVNMLGTVITKRKKTIGLDKLFVDNLYRKVHLFEKEDAVNMAAANIRVMAERCGTKKVFAIGAASNETEEKLCGELAAELKKSGIDMEYGKSIIYDARALQRAAEVGTAVVICAPGVSTYDEIAETLDRCINQKSNVLGILVVS